MEKKLTKLQRYTAYCIMIAMIEENFYSFYCHCIEAMGFEMDEKDIKLYFPELWNKRPKVCVIGNVWFSVGKKNITRTRILEECIIETSPSK